MCEKWDSDPYTSNKGKTTTITFYFFRVGLHPTLPPGDMTSSLGKIIPCLVQGQVLLGEQGLNPNHLILVPLDDGAPLLGLPDEGVPKVIDLLLQRGDLCPGSLSVDVYYRHY